MNDFFANKPYDRNPDYGRVLVEAYLREVAKRAVSLIQPTKSMISSPFPFSPYRTYSMDPEASLQIFGFRGYVCDKCLTAETHYVAFPEAKGQGGLQRAHFCDSANAVAARESAKALHGRIPELMKQKVNSRNGNYNYLFALRLPSPHEEIIKLRNPANTSKPGIVFRYSEQRHISVEPDKENKNKCEYLMRAIRLGTTTTISLMKN